jgi:tRNA(fMet)-specific endonuclease VapC
MRYLLDTNIVSDMVRDPFGARARQFARIGQSNIGVSIIVASELLYGIARRGQTDGTRKTRELLNRLFVAPFEHPAELHYAEIRAHLERVGTPIGANDTLIAAHALALGCTLVTDNEREFGRVPALHVENWLR